MTRTARDSKALDSVLDRLRSFPLPLIVLDANGVTIHENAAYRAKLGSGAIGRELAIALIGGRASALRAALHGVCRVLPVGPIGGRGLDAHYFPILDASGGTAAVGVLFVENKEQAVITGPPSAAATSGEMEQSLRFILDGMPQLVWSTRPDGHHDFYNRRWYEYTGADPNATRGAGWNDPLHPDDQQRAWEHWKRSLETGEDYEIEYRFRRADGVYRWFLGRALPMRDPSGRILRWFGTCTDVDDQKKLEQQRAEVLAQAEATSRMKDEFLAIVSHELRTPLTAILGWARMQSTRPELAPKAIAVIQRNAEAQAKLIEEILETSRIVSGKITLCPRRVDVAEAIHAALDAVRPSADANGLTIDAALPAAPFEITCDPDRLRQIVLNLLTNAVKFTPRGGRVSVHVDASDRSHVRIVVSDTGKGIVAQALPHVFERFWQADKATTRRHGGLGLGLAIVKHLVELHCGAIAASSEGDGKGATFVVTLPVTPALLGAARAHPGPRDADADRTPARLDGVHVLVVDDEADARELVAMVLREAGAETSEASSAASALAAIDRATPDVLVSDIGMPDEDGYSFMHTLRTRATRAALPAVALSAFTRTEDVQRSHEAGFDRHLAKPVDPLELVAAVRQLAHA